jgi:hypothetical protein
LSDTWRDIVEGFRIGRIQRCANQNPAALAQSGVKSGGDHNSCKAAALVRIEASAGNGSSNSSFAYKRANFHHSWHRIIAGFMGASPLNSKFVSLPPHSVARIAAEQNR